MTNILAGLGCILAFVAGGLFIQWLADKEILGATWQGRNAPQDKKWFDEKRDDP